MERKTSQIENCVYSIISTRLEKSAYTKDWMAYQRLTGWSLPGSTEG